MATKKPKVRDLKPTKDAKGGRAGTPGGPATMGDHKRNPNAGPGRGVR
jgi:hypothetical protein